MSVFDGFKPFAEKRKIDSTAIFSGEPILLSRHNIGLRLLQALRDEAHRFAISFHKELRHNLLELSVLDEISGVGKIRKKELLKNFGSIAELKKASPEEIHRKVPNINIALAEKILDILR